MTPQAENSRTLGTFAGVFAPSLLTILGMVLFLRLGFVVGGVGLELALVVLAVAHAVSILTSLSVSAIATNLRVKGGGDYYLISRTLGLGYGGAIGLVLFAAQSIAVGFYCIGFAEAVGGIVPTFQGSVWLSRALAVGAVIVLARVAWMGTSGAVRIQYLIMALMVGALGFFGFGAMQVWSPEQMIDNLGRPPGAMPFWVAFAVFFPAVTGFTQGISMSGDLRDPGRSIPAGTLLAVLVSMVVYLVAAVLFAGAEPSSTLAADGLAMRRLTTLPPLFDAGVIAATLSSALASLMGAPRILQAMARDKVLPILEPLNEGDGPNGNPRRALLLTVAIAVTAILAGSLNAVAAVVSMFFLLSYGLLNYATFYEASASSPSFRPAFRFYSRYGSLAGALLCLALMLAIDPIAATVAGAVVFATLQYLRLRAMPAQWADARRSYHLQQVRSHLLAAAREPEHPRNWRPQVLVFSGERERRAWILKLAEWIEGGAGISTVVQILERQGAAAIKEREAALKGLRQELADLGSTAYPLVVAASRLDDAIATVVQSAGVGPVQANTVIANWLRDHGAEGSFASARFSRNLRTAFGMGRNLLLLDANAEEWARLAETPGHARKIDIWWKQGSSAELMLLLAYLMTRAKDWEGAAIRVLALTADGEGIESREQQIRSRLESFRISAEVRVFASGGRDILLAESASASLVFIPFIITGDHFYGPHGSEIGALLDRLPITVLAMAADEISLDADPDGPDPIVDDPQEAE